MGGRSHRSRNSTVKNSCTVSPDIPSPAAVWVARSNQQPCSAPAQTTTLQVMTLVPNLETRSLMEIAVLKGAKRATDIMEMGNPNKTVVMRATAAKMNTAGRTKRTDRRKTAVSASTVLAANGTATVTTVLAANVTATMTTVLAANVTATMTTVLAANVTATMTTVLAANGTATATTVLAVDVATAGTATTVLAVEGVTVKVGATGKGVTIKENMVASMATAMDMDMAMGVVMGVATVMDEEDTGNRKKIGRTTPDQKR
ncbi:hypothetical protein OJAV_G00013610 [Oryzias javanicus]|uniref:Uncharacterized protein n=1 Tax=Oryzias javanicus TaxID=123683 RepID=A0A3S2MV36_ORYJA|nr:hypothetical protein OJAV_G00013610 [Oryzias javanicus]